MNVAMEGDALGFQLLHAALDNALFHLEVGNAIAQQPTGRRVLVVDVDLVAGASQLLRGGETRGTRADDGDPLARLLFGRLGCYPALGKGLVGDGALDGFDRHRLVVDVERTSGLAGRRTDTPGYFGEVVGRVQ